MARQDKIDTPSDGMENVRLNNLNDEVDRSKATKLPLRERMSQRKVIIAVCGLTLLVLLAVIIGIIFGVRASSSDEPELRLGRYLTTITDCGSVEGVYDDDVYKFYNIPYAAPPVGERRFTYAQPLNLSQCWNGTRPAHRPGPYCLQRQENDTFIGEEDCLTLDVVTPRVRSGSPLPVVVLIGADTLAGGVSPLQPSALYARTKQVVFVRPNFRLGALGFLALDILSGEPGRYPRSSGNYALSDLLAALQWVQLNAQHFGGDPRSVTLLAHRAGATLAAALSTVPAAQKLYSRAWLSSPDVFPGEPLAQAEKANEEFKSRSSCVDAACLRRMSTVNVLAATPDSWHAGGDARRSWLVLDGELLREHVSVAWGKQGEERKPMVCDTSQDVLSTLDSQPFDQFVRHGTLPAGEGFPACEALFARAD